MFIGSLMTSQPRLLMLAMSFFVNFVNWIALGPDVWNQPVRLIPRLKGACDINGRTHNRHTKIRIQLLIYNFIFSLG
jgi:hypothetical protein